MSILVKLPRSVSSDFRASIAAALPSGVGMDTADYTTIRSLLKSQLGFNSRQVSCSRSNGGSIVLTVRDPLVDLNKVCGFAALFHTYRFDMYSDMSEGQDVRVDTTSAVDTAHAAPFLEEISKAVGQIRLHQILPLSNGTRLYRDEEEGFRVQKGFNRGRFVPEFEVLARTPWAIESLALSAARLGSSGAA